MFSIYYNKNNNSKLFEYLEKHDFEKVEIKENEFNEEFFKKKPIEFYNFLIEKIAEL